MLCWESLNKKLIWVELWKVIEKIYRRDMTSIWLNSIRLYKRRVLVMKLTMTASIDLSGRMESICMKMISLLFWGDLIRMEMQGCHTLNLSMPFSLITLVRDLHWNKAMRNPFMKSHLDIVIGNNRVFRVHIRIRIRGQVKGNQGNQNQV